MRSSGNSADAAACLPSLLQCFFEQTDRLLLVQCLDDLYLVALIIPDESAGLLESPTLGLRTSGSPWVSWTLSSVVSDQ